MTPDEFYADWVDLYDRMVDWAGRLAGEGPALVGLLRSVGARKVLDVACGTGRHAAYLAEAGFEVAGADVSPAMLNNARRHVSRHGVALFEWAMQSAPPAGLAAMAPFDVLLCLGNSFPHLVSDGDVRAALGHFHSLLRPGGLLVVGLKALTILKSLRQPFLPLVKRSDGGGDLFFVRFYDFNPGGAGASAGPADVADFHLLIVGRSHPHLARRGGVHHAVNRLRCWSPPVLAAAVGQAGFDRVTVTCDLAGTPWKTQDGEDIFVIAFCGESSAPEDRRAERFGL